MTRALRSALLIGLLGLPTLQARASGRTEIHVTNCDTDVEKYVRVDVYDGDDDARMVAASSKAVYGTQSAKFTCNPSTGKKRCTAVFHKGNKNKEERVKDGHTVYITAVGADELKLSQSSCDD